MGFDIAVCVIIAGVILLRAITSEALGGGISFILCVLVLGIPVICLGVVAVVICMPVILGLLLPLLFVAGFFVLIKLIFSSPASN